MGGQSIMSTNLSDEQMDSMVAAVAAGDIAFDRAAPAPELPPTPDAEVMAVYSTRLPTSLAQRIAQLAKAKGVKPATLMREYIEIGVAAEEDDRPISLTDALRALTQLRKAA
jgi:predicted DNA-binding protein